MAVTFGTPVEHDAANTTSVAFAMSGVTSGQPIVVVYSPSNSANLPTGISDNFSTHYTWTVVDTQTNSFSMLRTYIGTGGVGSSGTITVTCATNDWPAGVAIPCIGASTASGLSAIDVHGGGTNVLTETLLPHAAGEGAVFAIVSDYTITGGNPTTPWVNTQVQQSSTEFGDVATYASPPNGVGLSNTWTGTASGTSTAGLIVKAGGPTAPSAPTIGTATAGNAQATVNWSTPGSNGGSAITGYVITPSSGSPVSVGVVTSYTVTGLTNGTAYDFTVAAINAIGTGSASGSSNSVTPATVPDAPTIGTATAGNTTATVNWSTPGSDGGSTITGYVITPSSGSPVSVGVVTSYTVTGLTNGTAYTFTVAAINAIGTGSASGSSNSVTPVPGVDFGTPVEHDYANTTSVAFAMTGVTSGQPIVVIYSTFNTSNAPTGISDTFSTPYTWTVVDTKTNSASMVRTYIGTGGAGSSGTITVTCASGDWPGGVAIPCIGASTASGLSAIDVHGGNTNSLTESLTPGAASEGAVFAIVSDYTITGGNPTTPWVDSPVLYTTIEFADVATYASPPNGVTLSNTWTGSGGATATVTVGLIMKASAFVPGAPTIGTATGGNAQATVNWSTPGSNGGSAITGYVITPSSGSPVTVGVMTSYTVTGLTNGTAYTFTVAAINAIGTGSASGSSNSVTPATVPGVPTIGTATAGNARATVNWSTPGSNGGSAITGYVITPSSGSPVSVGVMTSYVFPGLTNGTAYTFTVAAINAIGTGSASGSSNSVTPASLSKALADTSTLADSISRVGMRTRALSGTETLVDSLTRGQVLSRLLVDNELLGDSIVAAMRLSSHLSDNELLSDSIFGTRRLSSYLSDNEFLGDSIVRYLFVPRSFIDIEVLGDSLAASLIFIKSLTETEVLADFLNQNSVSTRSLSDLESITDTTNRYMILYHSFTDTEILVDSFVASAVLGYLFSDTEVLNDSTVSVRGGILRFVDQELLVDVFAKSFVAIRAISDLENSNDSLIRDLSYSLSNTEILDDLVERSGIFSRLLSDQDVMIDSLIRTQGWIRSLAYTELVNNDLIGFLSAQNLADADIMNDILTRYLVSIRGTPDTSLLGDLISLRFVFQRNVADHELLDDFGVAHPSATLLLEDIELLSDSIIAAMRLSSRLSDHEALVGSLTRGRISSRVFVNHELLTDVVIRHLHRVRSLAENDFLDDDIAGRRILARFLNNFDYLNDSFARFSSFFRLIFDNEPSADYVTRTRNLGRTISNSDSLIDALSTLTLESRLFADSLLEHDLNSRLFQVVRLVNEGLSETDSLIFVFPHLRTVFDSLSESDVLTVASTIYAKLAMTLTIVDYADTHIYGKNLLSQL